MPQLVFSSIEEPSSEPSDEPVEESSEPSTPVIVVPSDPVEPVPPLTPDVVVSEAPAEPVEPVEPAEPDSSIELYIAEISATGMVHIKFTEPLSLPDIQLATEYIQLVVHDAQGEAMNFTWEVLEQSENEMFI